MIENDLGRWAKARGVRFAVSGIDVLDIVRGKLEGRRDEGLIDGTFFREKLGGFKYLREGDVVAPEALLLVSVSRPAHLVSFASSDRTVSRIVPPTYHRYREFFGDVLAELKGAFGPEVPIAILQAPLKSLSVHMGMAVYGRNNVTYVPGLGSYHQLCGFVVGGEAGRRLRRAFGSARPRPAESSLKLCGTCRACVKACPTGAIREDRFLISAEKCYTLYSEARGVLPNGIRPAGPACVVGCLTCQEVCPENRGKLMSESLDIEFTDAETRVLLELGRIEAAGKGGENGLAPAGVPPALWAAVREKFDRLQISEDLEAVARNLDGSSRPGFSFSD